MTAILTHPVALFAAGVLVGGALMGAFLWVNTVRQASAEHQIAQRCARGFTLTRTNLAWTLVHPAPAMPTFTSRPRDTLQQFVSRIPEIPRSTVSTTSTIPR